MDALLQDGFGDAGDGHLELFIEGMSSEADAVGLEKDVSLWAA